MINIVYKFAKTCAMQLIAEWYHMVKILMIAK
jgi:hypothetical protein